MLKRDYRWLCVSYGEEGLRGVRKREPIEDGSRGPTATMSRTVVLRVATLGVVCLPSTLLYCPGETLYYKRKRVCRSLAGATARGAGNVRFATKVRNATVGREKCEGKTDAGGVKNRDAIDRNWRRFS